MAYNLALCFIIIIIIITSMFDVTIMAEHYCSLHVQSIAS